MKQTNSSLRQALEGGIDPLRPPEVGLLFELGCGEGFFLEMEQKEFCWEHVFECKRYIPCSPGQHQVQLPLDHR